MPAPVVFVHVPKTAGSTFLSILRRNFPVSNVLLPDALKEKNREELELRLQLLAAGPLDRVGSIHGHVPLSYLGPLGGGRFMTLLREPVQRQYSHVQWIYAKRKRHVPVPVALAKGRLIDNLQTRMLCGLEDPLTRPADDELLRAALAQLECFAFVGFVERFPESMLLAKERLGLRHVSYFRRNVGGGLHDPSDVEALRAHNVLDLQLYAIALAQAEPELDRVRPRAAALARADAAMSSRRLVTDPAAAGYVSDFLRSAVAARARRSWSRSRV